jgi:hypothetical protein
MSDERDDNANPKGRDSQGSGSRSVVTASRVNESHTLAMASRVNESHTLAMASQASESHTLAMVNPVARDLNRAKRNFPVFGRAKNSVKRSANRNRNSKIGSRARNSTGRCSEICRR